MVRQQPHTVAHLVNHLQILVGIRVTENREQHVDSVPLRIDRTKQIVAEKGLQKSEHTLLHGLLPRAASTAVVAADILHGPVKKNHRVLRGWLKATVDEVRNHVAASGDCHLVVLGRIGAQKIRQNSKRPQAGMHKDALKDIHNRAVFVHHFVQHGERVVDGVRVAGTRTKDSHEGFCVSKTILDDQRRLCDQRLALKVQHQVHISGGKQLRPGII
mmetsp:Transcript_57086/g.134369  ORF Transcript_57086/g.134369 Transcript_57086/m.134369 type:complete len:216 (-) Transcript_57086:107-754(-)